MSTETKEQRRQWSQRHLLVLERELKAVTEQRDAIVDGFTADTLMPALAAYPQPEEEAQA